MAMTPPVSPRPSSRSTRQSEPNRPVDSWKVGELARRTGLTVRALHHYDEIGLLTPSGRTPAGHRIYTRADVVRLQQVQSLRLMGLPLDEVKRLLDGAALSPRRVIDLHLAKLQDQIAAQTRLVERLTALATQLDQAEGVSMDDLCRMIEAMTTMEKYFTPEQLETLRQRREGIGEDRIQQVQDEWAYLIPAVREKMAAGVAPESPEVLALARRWMALVQEFTGGDAAIGKAVMAMYQHEGDTLKQQMGGDRVPTSEMFAYIGKANAAIRAQGPSQG